MALADPDRWRILQRLATSEARVTDGAAEFSISLNSVSKRIRVLERARLIEQNVPGRGLPRGGECTSEQRAGDPDACGIGAFIRDTLLWPLRLQ